MTVLEAARVFIDEEMKRGKTIVEIRRSEIEFQRKILDIKIKIENELPKNKIIFFDRAIPDSIAYFQICGFDPQEVIKICKKNAYRKIFLLERLPLEKDYARTEDDETMNKLQIFLKKAYSDLGYEVIDIPVMPVEDRLKMILSNIDSR